MIERFFTQDFELYRKNFTKESGRVVETSSLIKSFKGRLDPQDQTKQIISDKKTFTITDLLFAPMDPEVFNGDVIKHDGKEYEVIRNIEPFTKSHHQEILLERIV